jgi:hypothetical protein
MGGGINSFFRDKEKAFYVKYRTNPSQPNDYGTDGATLSADGKTFIVAVGEYDGKMDLYISRKNAYGQWSYMKRLAISTLGNERSPFLSADGKTLYFASDGYGGWGGLDIFKTTLYDNNECGDIYNLGEPINTKGNDCGFVTNLDNTTMLMIQNNDIISIKPVLPPLPNKEFPEINPKKD